ncbi:MAG: PDZ domain-containing protein [Planctomycetaceae bacterium]|nr:PDZ domain-containing protein [Planctomycetaceae bacterium]
MSKKHFGVLLAGVVLTAALAVVVNQSFVAADEEKKAEEPAAAVKKEDSKEDGKDKDISLPVYAPSTYWIGVRVVPVPEILLPQFGVKDENSSLAVVESVVPKSPADKAGVKRGDVVIKFGDKNIGSLEELVEQVSKVKNAEQKLLVYREGKKTELKVTPEERPAEAMAGQFGGGVPPMMRGFKGGMQRMPQPNIEKIPGMRLGPKVWLGQKDPREMMKQMEEYFRQMQGGNDADQFMLMPDEDGGAAMKAPEGTGKQLMVTTKTDKDGKTKITVRQIIRSSTGVDEKTWEASSFEELPEEIQRDVQELLGK